MGVPVFVRARMCGCVRIWIPGKEGGEVEPNGALRATSASGCGLWVWPVCVLGECASLPVVVLGVLWRVCVLAGCGVDVLFGAPVVVRVCACVLASRAKRVNRRAS